MLNFEPFVISLQQLLLMNRQQHDCFFCFFFSQYTHKVKGELTQTIAVTIGGSCQQLHIVLNQ